MEPIKIKDVVYAIKLILLGYEKGLYPQRAIRASHAKLFNEDINNGVLGSIGRGLHLLEKIGILERVSSTTSRAIKYRLRGCSGHCFIDGTLCGKYQTMECPIMKLKALLLILESRDNVLKALKLTHLVSERVRSEVIT